MIGTPRLEARIEWMDEVDGERCDTLFRLSLWRDHQPVWPKWGDAGTDLEVFADDVLSFFTENWQRLLVEQDYPQGLTPRLPADLWLEAERKAESEPKDLAHVLFASVEDFETAHEMSQAIGGQYELPPLWMVRAGEAMLLQLEARTIRVDLQDWSCFATNFGDAIAARLSDRSGERFDRLIEAWRRRDSTDPLALLSMSIGQPPSVSQALVQAGLLTMEDSIAKVANDDGVLRLAARMVGAAPYSQISHMLATIKAMPSSPSEQLDRLANLVKASVEDLDPKARPYEQGVHAARELRGLLCIAPDRQADPFQALAHLGVPCEAKPLQMAGLDALAIFGSAHGPAVVLNSDSRRFKSGRDPLRGAVARATAAHEICHLLLDGGRALAAVEVFSGRMDPLVEKRARAFAAEFLLPAETAAGLWKRSDLSVGKEGLSLMIDRLVERFTVSRALAARQLEHGIGGSDVDALFWIGELVPRRLN